MKRNQYEGWSPPSVPDHVDKIVWQSKAEQNSESISGFWEVLLLCIMQYGKEKSALCVRVQGQLTTLPHLEM